MTAAQFRKTVSGVGGYSSSAMTSKCTTHGCPGDIHELRHQKASSSGIKHFFLGNKEVGTICFEIRIPMKKPKIFMEFFYLGIRK